MPTLIEQLNDLERLSEARRPVHGPSKDEWFRNTYQIAAQRGSRKGELWGFKKMVNYAMKFIQGGKSAWAIMLRGEVEDGNVSWKELREAAMRLVGDRKFMEPGLVPHFAASMVTDRLYKMVVAGKLGKKR